MWEDFEVHAESIPALKLGFHVAQILFGFVLWCLEIAVFRADGAAIVGNNGWTFAVFFLSVPAWIYLIGAPRFPRTRKAALPGVMLGVDIAYTVIWLSAFASQAAYNTANLCGPVCGISKAIVGMGFFVFLFFGVTSFLSIWTLKYYQFHKRLPGYDRNQRGGESQNIDPDKAAFSLAPHDEEAYAPVQMNDHDDDHHDGRRSDFSPDPYAGQFTGGASVAGGSQVGSSYTDNPFRQDANPFDNETEYNSGRVSAAGGRYASPSARDDFDDDSGPATFPDGNYDRIHR